MAIKTYPLNDIDYQAEDAELFHCTRTSGVYASGHFPVSVTGTDNNITIGKGIGWLKNTEFSGKVFASKEETTLNAGVPDASLPRVDAVVVRFDANQNETYFTIKQGSVGSNPTPPEVERGEYIYELHLYHIRRRPGATAITPGDITDLRMDANYCGLMADSVTQVDMSAINAQVREFITDWESQIENVTDGKMIEAPEYPGCYYRMNRGVKEWLNPPMMEDVEYPTTKRQEGKRVYTKLLKARMQAGSISLPGVERIVSAFAVAERVSSGEKLMFQLPAFELPADNPRVQNLQIYYNDDTIFIQAIYSKGTYNLYVTVEYTKLEEEAAYTNVTADGDNIIVETNGNVSAQGDNLNVEMFTTVSADGGAYIRRLTINGVAYDLAVSQAGSGEPGTAYPGVPGQTYMDTDTGDLYKCVSAENGVYVWESANEATKLTAKKPYRDTLSKVSIEADGPQVMKVSGETAGVESTEDFVIVRGLYPPVLPQDAANKQYVDSKIGTGSNSGAKVNSVYEGKRMSILADSISTFIGWIPSGNAVFYTGSNCGVSSVNDIWWKKLLDALGATLMINQSWSGSRVTTTGGNESAGCVRCENLGDNPDVIIVYLGINDFNHEVALGTYDGNGAFPTDTTTFREAYAIMLDKILTKYKTAEVWVCTLPYCERNGDLTFPEKNANNVLLNDFNAAIRELADLFGVRVLEHAKCGMNYHNMSEYMGDYSEGAGLHPNAYGHSLIANNDIWQIDPAVRTRYAISGAPDAVTLVSISAVYSGGPVTVGVDVSTLTGVAVTAHYSDGSSTSVTGYTLSGTIAEGDNVITVSYEGLTATISVPGVAVDVEYTLDDIAVVKGSMGAAVSGEITCDISRSTDRRTYWVKNGEKPVLINKEPSEYFPFPIPDSATTAHIAVNASTQVLGIMMYTLSDNVYTMLKNVGWVNSNETTQTLPTGTNRYLCIGAKCSDNGNFEETDEATAMTVRFY